MEVEQNQAVPAATDVSQTSGSAPIASTAQKAPRSSLSMLAVGAILGLLFVGLVAAVFGVAYVILRKDDSKIVNNEQNAEDEDVENEGIEDKSTGGDETTDSTDSAKTPVLSEATDGDSWTFPTGIFGDDYTYVRYLCDGYAGMDPDYYYMDVEYPSYVTVTTDWLGVGSLGKCDLQFAYGTSMMRMQFNVGEAYPVNLLPGYQDIRTVGGKTLYKTAMELNGGYYSYSYVTAIDDADCDGGEMLPELTAPCASPIHPFLPGATMVSVMIPETTGASERGDIVDLFDDLAQRMHGAEN